MGDSLTRNEKLLALISEIRHIIGPFDATSILLKANIDKPFDEPGIGEDADSINRGLAAEVDSRVISYWTNERVPGRDSLLISPDISSSAHPSHPATSKSVDSNQLLTLNRPNDEDGYIITNVCEDVSPMRSKVDYFENTLFLNRQAKHPASAESINVRNIHDAIDKTAVAESPVTLSKSSAPVGKEVRALIIEKDIDSFLQDLPTNSPVRTIITNAVTSVSPSRRALEAAKRGIDPSGYKIDKQESDPLITDGDAEVNFIEFVTVGDNQKSALGLESSYQKMSSSSLKTLSEEQRNRLKILDHFRSDVTDKRTMCMIETISDYCFPIGALIDIVRKEDLIDFTGPVNDSFHVMQFSDVTGTPTYACCLTTVQSMLPPNKAVIQALMMQKRIYARAVAIIIRAFRYCSRKRKELLYFSSEQIEETEFSIFDMKHSFYSMNTPFKFGAAKNLSDAAEGDVKQSVTAGFGSVIMSRLKKGISFAGGRTVEKIPAAAPFVETSKILWSDIDEDTEKAECSGVDRVTAHNQSELDEEESVGNEKEAEDGVSADDENSEGDDDGRSSDDGEDTPLVRLEALQNESLLFIADHRHLEKSHPLEALERIHTPKMREKCIPDNPLGKDLGTTAKGHSVRELEGLHLHGFSSESEGEGEGEVTGEEGGERSTADPDSSFESASNSSVKSSSHRNEIVTALRTRRESSSSFAVVSPYSPLDAESHMSYNRDDEDLWNTSNHRSRYAGDAEHTGYRSQRVSMGSVGTRNLSASNNSLILPSVSLLPLMSDDVDDYALLTKKAYCLIGPKPLHSLFFSILSAIAEQERQERHSSENSAMTCTDVSEVVIHNELTGGDLDVLLKHLDKEEEPAQLVADKPEGCSVEIPTSSIEDPARSHPDLMAFLRHMRDCKIQSNQIIPSSLCNIPSPIGDVFIRNNVSLALQEEWTCGVLLNVLPCATIMQTLSLLLLESSLVVCGPPSASGLVTAITTAFKLLLLPFEWAGIFVPILPSNALEIMEAPVPFIVGTIHTLRASCISPSAAVLYLGDFLDPFEGNFMSPMCHLNTQNLQPVKPRTNKDAEERSYADVADTSDKECVTMTTDEASSVSSSSKSAHLRNSPRGNATQLKSRMKRYLQPPVGEGVRGSSGHSEFSSDSSYQGLVSKLQRVKTKLRRLLFSAGNALQSPLHCHDESFCGSHIPLSIELANQCMKRYLLYMSSEERRTVSELLPLIKRHTTGLCGPLATDPFACQKYGVVNSSSGHFDFYPEMFLDPLKARLRFQEDLAHTQMFLSFIDMKREEHTRKMQENRIFLADWIAFRLIRKRSASVRKKRGRFSPLADT